MNAATHRVYRMVGRLVWFVTGMASIGIGLQAAGFNLCELLHLCPVLHLVHYGLGVCGVASILMFFMQCCTSCKTR